MAEAPPAAGPQLPPVDQSTTADVNQDTTWFANIKRTYDEMQQESLETIRQQRSYISKVLSDAAQFDGARQTIANQALQNAVENANIIAKTTIQNLDAQAKQHLAHRDIATSALWDPVEQAISDVLGARAVTIDDAALKAIGASIAAAVSDALKQPKPTTPGTTA